MKPPPYTSIVCPTDLSAAGDDAVVLAYSLAAPGGTVHLVTICEPSYVASPFDLTPVMTTPPTPAALEALEAKVKVHLKRLVPEAAEGRRVTTQMHVVHDVNPAAVIQRVATELKADLVVMGTHGRTGLGRLLMGSVATDVLRHSRTPVILARNGKK